jgi:hypothetical protein
MAFKTVGWFLHAQRWQAKWYGVTDDDALIDLPPLLLLLDAAPLGPSWAGVANYYYLNATSLEAARQNKTRNPCTGTPTPGNFAAFAPNAKKT